MPACPTVTLVYQTNYTQWNASSDPRNKYGVEDGIVVRRADGGLTMICAEMYGDPKWVRMRLGVYKSADGMQWRRKRALRQSTVDLTGKSAHSSSWGPFFSHDPSNDTWMLSYVGYRGAQSNASGWLTNFDGTIYARYATSAGDKGLDGNFGEEDDYNSGGGSNGSVFDGDSILLTPDDFNVNGPWPHTCQGLQGTDSMFPYQLNDGSWAAFVGTAHTEKPDPWTGTGKWPVSLARAPRLAGPWTRFNPTDPKNAPDAPCVDLNGGFSENPIVARRPDNASAFHVVFDDLAHQRRGFGYACSEDGLTWDRYTVVNVSAGGGCRTPFGLIPMMPDEIHARTSDILRYGVLNSSSQLYAGNTSLQWLFYSQQQPSRNWEAFRAAIVQLRW